MRRSVRRTACGRATVRPPRPLRLGGLVVLAVACADPEVEQRLQELEQRVAALEAEGRPAAPGVAVAPPPVATPARETDAAAVLREASEAIDRLDWDAARSHLDRLKTEFAETRSAKAAARLVSEVEAVGKPAPELTVEEWIQGSAADLAGGDAVLYVFWEAWCSHCQRDLPRIAQLYERHKGDGLRVVGITRMSKGVTDEQADAFLRDLDVRYPNAKDPGDAFSRAFNVTGIPAAAVVKDGKVVWRGGPHKLTDELLSRWL